MQNIKKYLTLGILGVLVVVVLLLVVFNKKAAAPTDNNSATTGNQNVPDSENATDVSLALLPSRKEVSVGESFTLDIMLDTAGVAIDGVDIYSLRYDASILSVVDTDDSKSGVQIAAGNLMQNVSMNQVKEEGSTGLVQFAQITSAKNLYTGQGKLATITFKAIKSGSASVNFDFQAGNGKDTNVASEGVDKLNKVINAVVTVK
jgi:hypothetical protein